MVRGKVEMKRIENATSRQVTFTKRRTGMFKKAYELSVLCDADVALIIFSQKGRLYEFSSSNMKRSIQRYMEHRSKQEWSSRMNDEQHVQNFKKESEILGKKIELLENSQRKLLGHDLGTSSMDEINEIDNQLEKSLKKIRTRKAELFEEEIVKLNEKQKFITEENSRLREKLYHILLKEKIMHSGQNMKASTKVVTDLFIGPTPTHNVEEAYSRK